MSELPERAVVHEPVPVTLETDMTRRSFLLAATGAAVVVAVLGACTAPHGEPAPVPSAEQKTTEVEALLQHAGNSLLELHSEQYGGWRFRSEIQAPHYQTDRDVGAASVGVGFLTLADQYPNDKRWVDGWVNAAKQTATWLTAVSKQDSTGGRYWPDYHDNGKESGSYYTSFDDGAIGIGDFYWQLYEKTHDPEHKDIALQSVRWTLSQAEDIGGDAAPMYRWKWDVGSGDDTYYTGMGEGSAGIIETLATYYQRTKDSDPAFAAMCKRYIDGGLRWLDHTRTNLGDNDGDSRAVPETGVIGQDGDTEENSGYLSGAAGLAFMYLKLHQVFGGDQYLQKADELFGWLNDTADGPKVDFGDGTATWKLALDPQGGDDTHYVTGFEEGNAGIGWTYLQAYNLTHRESYLATAKQAADWLLETAMKDAKGGWSWHEYEHPASPHIHPNLNNGAAGIGMFLLDMFDATKDTKYKTAAEGVQAWLANTAVHKGDLVYWNDTDDGTSFGKDPSWHWGSAGIIAFLARMAGSARDVPGEQPALSSP